MHEFIIRSLQKRTSAREERELRAWRASSPDNEQLYQEIAEIWSATEAGRPKVSTTPPKAGEILHAADSRQTIALRHRRPRRARIGRWGLTAAAAVVVAALGLSLARVVHESTPPSGLSFGVTEYHTSAGERVTVRLADGSIVRLAPSSRLRFTGEERVREVVLEGQAFFAVAKNADYPFVVRTRAGDAHVLGTRFDLRVSNGDLRVVVVDGRVGVAVRDRVVEVGAGQMTIAPEDAEPAIVEVADVHAMLDWMGQSLVFQDTPLAQAAREIERLYDARIEVGDEELSRRTITAWFTDQTFEDVITIVCRVVQAKCSISEKAAKIRP